MDNSTGVIGEKFTEKYLKKHGYKIIEKNYHSRFGEIDIIATKKDIIAFVEVKTRGENHIFEPIEAITVSKVKKIKTTAQIYLQYNELNKQPRFDVSSVITKNKKPISIEYIENAF